MKFRILFFSILILVCFSCARNKIIDNQKGIIEILNNKNVVINRFNYKIYDESPENIIDNKILYDSVEILDGEIFSITKYIAKYNTTLPHLIEVIDVYNNMGEKICELDRMSRIFYNKKYKMVVVLKTRNESIYDYSDILIYDSINRSLILNNQIQENKYNDVMMSTVLFNLTKDYNYFYYIDNSKFNIFDFRSKKLIEKNVDIELENINDAISVIDNKKDFKFKNNDLEYKISVSDFLSDFMEFKIFQINYNLSKDLITVTEIK